MTWCLKEFSHLRMLVLRTQIKMCLLFTPTDECGNGRISKKNTNTVKTELPIDGP